jgi:hypothetical protein
VEVVSKWASSSRRQARWRAPQLGNTSSRAPGSPWRPPLAQAAAWSRGGGGRRCGTECAAWSGFNEEGESVPAGWRTPGITHGTASGIGRCACIEEHRDGPQGLAGCGRPAREQVACGVGADFRRALGTRGALGRHAASAGARRLGKARGLRRRAAKKPRVAGGRGAARFWCCSFRLSYFEHVFLPKIELKCTK